MHARIPSDPLASVEQMQATEDWAQFVLDRPMSSAPGTTWNYHEGGSHLLSVLVQEKSGMSTLDFANRYLFHPLGIADVRWGVDPNGIAYGGHWLYLRSRDMAKFGYLYLAKLRLKPPSGRVVAFELHNTRI
jgi:CubicO group peptidase (beta-lactamase class C family)